MSGDPPAHVHDWESLRRQMSVTRRWAYFDHAAVSPLPEPARQAMAEWVADTAEQGDTNWSTWGRRVEEARRLAARLINADAAEIALVHSTTEGISLVAEGYPWTAGDNVVTLDNEFPSNVYPWMNLAARGVETRRVPTDGGRVNLDRLDAACDRHTRIITVSWVGYLSGWRSDLGAMAELAHRRGALLFVDAIQGLGAFPLDVQETPIDFLAAGGQKWLMGPEGTGLLYLRREHLDRLRAISVGSHSVVQGSDYTRIELNLKPTASRYEGGARNMAGFVGLRASLELLLAQGISAVAQRVLDLTDLVCRRLAELGAVDISPREGNYRSGIISFVFPGQQPVAVRERCLARGVALAARGPRLRISPHAYNNAQDVERMVEAFAAK